MNREDCASLLKNHFLDVEKDYDSQLEYLCFSIIFGNRDKQIDILSFMLGEERVRVFVLPYEHPGLSALNSKAILSKPEMFFPIKNDGELVKTISSILPEQFGASDISCGSEKHKIGLSEYVDYVRILDKLKNKKTKK